MSIVNLLLRPDAAEMVADTLAIRAGRPVAFVGKVDFLPHLRTLVGFAGSTSVHARVRYLLDGGAVRGVEDAAGLVARHLQDLLRQDGSRWGAAVGGEAVVLLAGWSEAEGRFVAFRVRSWALGPEQLGPGAHLEPDVIENLAAVGEPGDLVAVA